MPQLLIEHHARERFLAVSRNASRQSSARQAFIRLHVPSDIAADTSAPEHLSRIELRLCRVGDAAALEELAELDGKSVPTGRFVLAEVDGRIVAALPLAGGPLLADPFVPATHLHKLLEVRAAQVRLPHERRRLLPRYAGLIHRSAEA